MLLRPPNVDTLTQCRHAHPMSTHSPNVDIVTKCRHAHPMSTRSPSVVMPTKCPHAHPMSSRPPIVLTLTHCPHSMTLPPMYLLCCHGYSIETHHHQLQINMTALVCVCMHVDTYMDMGISR
jgi:hypothetical protein